MQPAPNPSAAAPTKGRGYIPGLDGIRAIAFLMVFGAHSLSGSRIAYFVPATLGVTLFFFLSGYLITTLLRKEHEATGTVSLRDFYIRRTLRIFIPLYLVYGLASLTAHALGQFPGNTFGFVSMLFYCYNYTNVLHLHAWLPPGLNVIWSLAVEEHFYLLFPLLYLALSRRVSRAMQRRLLVGFCVLELLWRAVLVLVFHQGGNWTYFATDARLDSILWGCILALNNNPVFADRSILPRGRESLVFLLALLGLVATLLPREELYRETLRYTLQALLFYVIFSYIIPNIGHWSVRWLEWTPLRYIGWISYVLYLSHDFIVDMLLSRGMDKVYLTLPLSLALSIAFATLMRYTVELPLQRLRARFRHVPAA